MDEAAAAVVVGAIGQPFAVPDREMARQAARGGDPDAGSHADCLAISAGRHAPPWLHGLPEGATMRSAPTWTG